MALALAAAAAAQTGKPVDNKACDVKVRLRGPVYDAQNGGLEPGLPETLDELARVFKERCTGKSLIIEANAFEMPTADLNLRLSELRAQLIRYELSKRGIPTIAMMPVAMGDTRPQVPASEPEAMQRNRRVTFRVID
jgi:outer membrane protein OmpA-like peptidoglycan-associated protein